MAGQQFICIYCLRSLAESSFNEEHVLSDGLVKFRPVPTLRRKVCGDCNQYFGDQLEVRFLQGAFEGLLRYQLGVKSGRLPRKFEFLRFELPESLSPDWAGLRLRPYLDSDGVRITICSQVGFFQPGEGRWKYFVAEELNTDNLRRFKDLVTKQIQIVCPSGQEHDLLVGRLRNCGIPFMPEGHLPLPKLLGDARVPVEITVTLNKGIQRCIAKYALNYLAYVANQRGFQTLVLSKELNEAREFIRYGTVAKYEIVTLRQQPILADDRLSRRQTNGHLLTVSWCEEDLIGEVSLFNHFTHRVCLSRDYRGVWVPVRDGIHYNLKAKCVQPLWGVPRSLTT